MTIAKVEDYQTKWKYPSTNAIRTALSSLRRAIDSNSDEKVAYNVTIKMHGTNASVEEIGAKHNFYAKERQLDITHDNHSFMARNMHFDWASMFNQVRQIHNEYMGVEIDPETPIQICGEWVGQGIQKGVALSKVPTMFVIFGVHFGHRYDTNQMWCDKGEVTDEQLLAIREEINRASTLNYWLPNHLFKDVKNHEARIFNVYDFKHYILEVCPHDQIDVEKFANQLDEIVQEIEKQCPVGEYFGEEGIGEGVVVTPRDRRLITDYGLSFKVKGDKHKSSNSRERVQLSVEEIESLERFADYVCTESRFVQAAGEIVPEGEAPRMQMMGEFIGWVCRDVVKEESDVLAENKLDWKKASKVIQFRAVNWFKSYINNQPM